MYLKEKKDDFGISKNNREKKGFYEEIKEVSIVQLIDFRGNFCRYFGCRVLVYIIIYKL